MNNLSLVKTNVFTICYILLQLVNFNPIAKLILVNSTRRISAIASEASSTTKGGSCLSSRDNSTYSAGRIP